MPDGKLYEQTGSQHYRHQFACVMRRELITMTFAHDDERLARQRKLSFRAWRRGFKEADIILGNYADDRLDTMTPEELDIFEILLEVPDQDLYGWIIEREPTPEANKSTIMSELNQYYKKTYTKI